MPWPQQRRQKHYLSQEQRAMIVGYHSLGHTSTRETAAHFDVHHSTVVRLMGKYDRLGELKDLPKSGRPKITSARQDAEIQRIVENNRKVTGVFICNIR